MYTEVYILSADLVTSEVRYVKSLLRGEEIAIISHHVIHISEVWKARSIICCSADGIRNLRKRFLRHYSIDVDFPNLAGESTIHRAYLGKRLT